MFTSVHFPSILLLIWTFFTQHTKAENEHEIFVISYKTAIPKSLKNKSLWTIIVHKNFEANAFCSQTSCPQLWHHHYHAHDYTTLDHVTILAKLKLKRYKQMKIDQEARAQYCS